MITIVSGLPRSGTSMMMRMLEAGGLPPLTDGLRAPDPDNPNGYYEFEPVKHTGRDAGWLRQADGRAVKMVHRLLRDLPPDRGYRVIFMQRALTEVVASQGRMLARMGAPQAGTPDRLRLVAGFAAEVAAIKAWLGQREVFQTLCINYNQLLADPRPALEGLAGFLERTGGPRPDVAAMRSVIDPRLYRQRAAEGRPPP